jgi:hypothetical protein
VSGEARPFIAQGCRDASKILGMPNIEEGAEKISGKNSLFTLDINRFSY